MSLSDSAGVIDVLPWNVTNGLFILPHCLFLELYAGFPYSQVLGEGIKEIQCLAFCPLYRAHLVKRKWAWATLVDVVRSKNSCPHMVTHNGCFIYQELLLQTSISTNRMAGYHRRPQAARVCNWGYAAMSPIGQLFVIRSWDKAVPINFLCYWKTGR